MQSHPGAEAESTLAALVAREIADWHADYSSAWESRDPDAIADLIAPDLQATMVMMDGETVWTGSREDDVAGVRDFLDYARRNQIVTDSQIHQVVARSRDEAIVLASKTVTIPAGPDRRTVTQLAVETLRRSPDGRWRLIRYWAEKARHVEEGAE